VFISEGGPECLSANQEAIQNCVNKTITKNLPTETLSVDNIPSLVFGEEQCRYSFSLHLPLQSVYIAE
jgi:hypothetical protein